MLMKTESQHKLFKQINEQNTSKIFPTVCIKFLFAETPFGGSCHGNKLTVTQ